MEVIEDRIIALRNAIKMSKANKRYDANLLIADYLHHARKVADEDAFYDACMKAVQFNLDIDDFFAEVSESQDYDKIIEKMRWKNEKTITANIHDIVGSLCI